MASCGPKVSSGLGGHRAALDSGEAARERDHIWQGREWDLKVEGFFLS